MRSDRYQIAIRRRLRALAVVGLMPIVIGGMVVVPASQARAHHSWSRYDSGAVLTLEGVMSAVEWASPHVVMRFVVTDDAGSEVEWTLEMDPPTLLSRYGLRHDSIAPGMRVKVSGVGARSGAPVMRAVMIELENGTVHRVSSRV